MNRFREGVASLAAALAVALTALTASPARAGDDEPGRPTLSVSGTGEVSVAADQAEITFGVTTSAKTASDALAENTARSEKVAAALRELGLGKEEVRTSQFTIFPEYGRQENVLTGYRVTNTVSVRSKKIDLAGKIVQRAVEAGANEFQGLSFTLSDKRGRDDAIRMATMNARHDAETLAGAAGLRLSKIRRISVDNAGFAPPPRPMYRMAMADAARAAAPDFTPGDVPVTATVTIEFDIEPAK